MNHINSNKKTRDFLVLNDIDIWMCEFMITSAQMYRKGAISNTDIKLYEDLITDYRIYLKSNDLEYLVQVWYSYIYYDV